MEYSHIKSIHLRIIVWMKCKIMFMNSNYLQKKNYSFHTAKSDFLIKHIIIS